MLKIFQAVMLMSFGTLLLGVMSTVISSTDAMIGSQSGLVLANLHGDISTEEYIERSADIDRAYRNDATTELVKVEGMIFEAEDVLNSINSKTNMELVKNTSIASEQFSEGILSLQNIE